VRGIVDYIENNFASDIDLNDLAGRFKMSKTYLCQSFKRETNQTVINYLNSIRMIHALKMFQKGEGNVSRVAMENGFHDVSYFIQLFKKSTGFTPKQFYKKSKVE
jgi:YesN/AraC family two-component response regulator